MENAVATLSDYELERGKPMPSLLHARAQSNLVALLYQQSNCVCVSELSLSLNDWDSVPDIAIYQQNEVDFSRDETKLTKPPLCAIEILSAAQTLDSLVDKAQKHFENGVKSCWIVIPRLKNIHVFESPTAYEIYREHQTLIDKRLGIEFPLSQIFK